MALSGSDKAYLQARSGIARSGAIRSNYVFPLFGVVTVNGLDFTKYIRYHTLTVRQALNEEPDQCSFEVMLSDATVTAQLVVGADVLIGLGGPRENVLFGGRVLTTQTTRGPAKTPSVRSVLCADYLQAIDSEYLITYNWPAQSATLTILDLVARFFTRPGGIPLTTTAVEATLPTHAAFAVINEKFSTVLRRLVTMFPAGGGFYVDPLKTLHVWAGQAEPNTVTPAALTLPSSTLKAFAETVEGTQQRDAVLVEGRRTTAPIGLVWDPPPTGWTPGIEQNVESIPVLDASILDPSADPGVDREIRVGSMRLLCRHLTGIWNAPAGTPQTTETTAAVAYEPNPADGSITAQIPVASLAFLTGRESGAPWVLIDEQYLRLNGWAATGGPAPGPWIGVWRRGFGAMLGPIQLGAVVSNVDSLGYLRPTRRYQTAPTAYELIRNQPIDSDVVLTVRSTTGPAIHEHLVQDGRYGRTGATNRGVQELADFSAPLTAIDWETEDLNARPGRLQEYNFPAAPHPATAGYYMILSAEWSWPVWGKPPRIRCHAARVSAANVIDTWLIDSR